ncbi:hypothetical protein C2W64_02090 [Brevibacillus laterosporus]|nr:hypothetical protein C2W64_02090 [Brevibacillus laterosporus]
MVAAIVISGASLVNAKAPFQNTVAQKQDSEKLYAGGFKKIPASEALADKNVKAALDGVYAQFPETKSYEISVYQDVDSSEQYTIRLNEGAFQFSVDLKTGKVIDSIRSLATSEALADKNVKAAVDRVHDLFPETKSYAIEASFLDRGDSSWYIITLSDKDFKNYFTVAVDSKTGQVSYTVQSVTASEVLSNENVKSGVDKMHALKPETKSYEITEASVTENNFSVSYHITLSDKDSEDSIVFSIDGKTGELIGY